MEHTEYEYSVDSSIEKKAERKKKKKENFTEYKMIQSTVLLF